MKYQEIKKKDKDKPTGNERHLSKNILSFNKKIEQYRGTTRMIVKAVNC